MGFLYNLFFVGNIYRFFFLFYKLRVGFWYSFPKDFAFCCLFVKYIFFFFLNLILVVFFFWFGGLFKYNFNIFLYILIVIILCGFSKYKCKQSMPAFQFSFVCSFLSMESGYFLIEGELEMWDTLLCLKRFEFLPFHMSRFCSEILHFVSFCHFWNLFYWFSLIFITLCLNLWCL